MWSDKGMRQIIRHRAKEMLLAGTSDVVRFVYDGNKLYAIYENDGQREAYEVSIELLNDNSILP